LRPVSRENCCRSRRTSSMGAQYIRSTNQNHGVKTVRERGGQIQNVEFVLDAKGCDGRNEPDFIGAGGGQNIRHCLEWKNGLSTCQGAAGFTTVAMAVSLPASTSPIFVQGSRWCHRRWKFSQQNHGE